MRNFLIVIILLWFSSFSNIGFSQTKTAYEKKKEAIVLKYLNKMGVSKSEIDRAKNADESGFLLMLLIAEKYETYAMNHGMDAVVLMTEMEKEMKAAESLKSEEDFRKERLAIEEKERKQREAQQAYEEKKQLEELQRQEQKRINFVNNSDYVILKKRIKQEFESWYEKGEFEKSVDHQNRIAQKDFAFDSICYQITSRQMLQRIGSQQYELKLLDYNADLEIFPVEIQFYPSKTFDSIKVPISEAESFKEDLRYRDNSNVLSFYRELRNWIFVDNYLFPKRLSLNGEKSILNLPNKEVSQIRFSTDELSLNNYFGSNHMFDAIQFEKVAEAREIKRRKEQYKSLMLVIENERNQKNYKNAIYKLEDLYRIFPDSVQIKDIINQVKYDENEDKRDVLLKDAQNLIEQGQLSKAKQKLKDANKLRTTEETSNEIKALETRIAEIKTKHEALYRLFYDEASKSRGGLFENDYFIINSIDKIKDGYGEKYKACLNYIANDLNSKWSPISNDYNQLVKGINWEAWGNNEQQLFDRIQEFQKLAKHYKNFNSKTYEATKAEDKKFLKIFKEDDLGLIIETVINTQR